MSDPAKLPWMKFYPNDWRGESCLRVCSLAARGLWMEMLAVMHEATPRGSLTMNGKAMTSRQIAALAGTSVSEVETLIEELRDAGVFSVDEGGTIYSRRMRRDEKKAREDKANGTKGGNPNLKPRVNPPANPPDNGGHKAQRPEARGQDPDPESSPPPDRHPREAQEGEGGKSLFDRFYEAFPKPKTSSRPAALAEFMRLDPETQQKLATGATQIAEAVRAEKTTHPLSAVRFLAERRFDGFLATAAPPRPCRIIRRDSPEGRARDEESRRRRGVSAFWLEDGTFRVFDESAEVAPFAKPSDRETAA